MKNIITACITTIILCILTFILLNIYKWKVDSHNTKKIITEIKKVIDNPKKPNQSIDFNMLLKQNKDTFGYIVINNTNISYPFVKTNNNSYYLNHSFNKKKNDAGWIFMDYRNKDFNDKNIILYGHDRKDNTLFGTLKNVLKRKWQKNKDNQIITIYTKDKVLTYQVFSTYHIKTEDYYITTNFNDKSFTKFIKTLIKRSNYNYKVNINKDDNILTLSTCYTTNEKVVLHAKLLK